jgi:hypothetical protein
MEENSFVQSVATVLSLVHIIGSIITNSESQIRRVKSFPYYITILQYRLYIRIYVHVHFVLKGYAYGIVPLQHLRVFSIVGLITL